MAKVSDTSRNEREIKVQNVTGFKDDYKENFGRR